MSNCPTCRGTKKVPNPAYPDRALILDRRLENGVLPYPAYESEMIRLFGSLENIPHEDIDCPVCTGNDWGQARRYRYAPV